MPKKGAQRKVKKTNQVKIKTEGGGLKTVSGIGLATMGLLGALGNASDPGTAIAGAAPLVASGVGLALSDKKKKKKD